MSAVLSLCLNGQIAVVTDGAAYQPDGTLDAIVRKVTTSTEFPIAVAARGNAYLGAKVSRLIVEWAERYGFDAGMELVEEVLPDLEPRNPPHDHIEVLIAGISETDGVTLRCFTTLDTQGVETLKLVDPGPVCWMAVGGDHDAIAESGIRRVRPEEVASDYMHETGVAWMEYFRRQQSAGSRGPGRYIVGGHVDLTIVDQSGARTVTIHRWPEDKVGEKINPFAGTNVTPLIRPVSHQQRRAAKREQRRQKRRSA